MDAFTELQSLDLYFPPNYLPFGKAIPNCNSDTCNYLYFVGSCSTTQIECCIFYALAHKQTLVYKPMCKKVGLTLSCLTMGVPQRIQSADPKVHKLKTPTLYPCPPVTRPILFRKGRGGVFSLRAQRGAIATGDLLYLMS